MKKILLPLALLATLTFGAGKISAEANSKPTVVVKPKTQVIAPIDSSKTAKIPNSPKVIQGSQKDNQQPNVNNYVSQKSTDIADYSDYYFNNAGVEMWVGSERGVSPFVSLNSGKFYGSGVIDYNSTDIDKNQSTTQLILNGGAGTNKTSVQAVGGLDIKKSNYSLDRSIDRLFTLNNGNGREVEISTSKIDNTANMFSFGASKKIGLETSVFSNFAQYVQMSKVEDEISNQYFSTTLNRDSTNSGIPIVVETRTNTDVYTDLKSNISNERKSSIFEMGFEKIWGNLFGGLINSKLSSDISLGSSEVKQSLFGQSITESYGNTRVIINGTDTTDVGFNSRTTTPVYYDSTSKAKDAQVGLNVVVGYNIPLGEKVRIGMSHRSPNQNTLNLDFVSPVIKYEKYNNQGSIFKGSLNFSKESLEFNFGAISDVSFFGQIDPNTIYSDIKKMSNITKKNLDQRRNLEESVIYSDDAKKVLARDLWSNYYQEISISNPFVDYGFKFDAKKRKIGIYGGYGDENFSVIGNFETGNVGITASKNFGKNRPSLEIGYDKDKKAIYSTFTIGLK